MRLKLFVVTVFHHLTLTTHALLTTRKVTTLSRAGPIENPIKKSKPQSYSSAGLHTIPITVPRVRKQSDVERSSSHQILSPSKNQVLERHISVLTIKWMLSSLSANVKDENNFKCSWRPSKRF